MAVSTTQSIWRSGGGDQTRQAYCGSGVMAAQFYIAQASATGALLNKANGQQIVLPAGAIVYGIAITTAASGTIDIGTVGVSSGTALPQSIANGLSIASTSTNAFNGTTVLGTPVAELSGLTSRSDTGASGTTTGILLYFVVDPLAGAQNV